MNADLFQTISNVAITVGIVLTALGGFGAFHFGKMVDAQKDSAHQKELNEKLEAQRKDLIGYAVGHESMAFLLPMILEPLKLNFGLENTSDYPVFDIYAEWIDLDEKIDTSKEIYWTRNALALGDLYPKKIMTNVLSFDFTDMDSLRINVFFQYRTGTASQRIKVRKVDTILKIAFWNQCGEYEDIQVPEDFPGYDPLQGPKSVFAVH